MLSTTAAQSNNGMPRAAAMALMLAFIWCTKWSKWQQSSLASNIDPATRDILHLGQPATLHACCVLITIQSGEETLPPVPPPPPSPFIAGWYRNFYWAAAATLLTIDGGGVGHGSKRGMAVPGKQRRRSVECAGGGWHNRTQSVKSREELYTLVVTEGGKPMRGASARAQVRVYEKCCYPHIYAFMSFFFGGLRLNYFFRKNE